MSNYLANPKQMDIAGSWHPRGFHGHTRSKSRIEFSNSFRQSAKPLPPEKFRVRQRDDALKHVFSQHDNKQIFLNDPNLFGAGFGKKKIDSQNKSKWKPEFMSWTNESGRDRFKRTIYQNDFCNSFQYPQSQKLLSNRKSLDTNLLSSVYAYSFINDATMKKELKNIHDETTERFVQKHRSKSCVGERLNVASCMVWHDCLRNTANTSTNPLPKADTFANANEIAVNTN